jgi:hypothetical protein
MAQGAGDDSESDLLGVGRIYLRDGLLKNPAVISQAFGKRAEPVYQLLLFPLG